MSEHRDFTNGRTFATGATTSQSSTSTRLRTSLPGNHVAPSYTIPPQPKLTLSSPLEDRIPIHLKQAPTFDRQRKSRCVRLQPVTKRVPKRAYTTNAIPDNRHGDDGLAIDPESLRHVHTAPNGRTDNFQLQSAVGEAENEKTRLPPKPEQTPYLVLGIFNRVDGRPQEKLILLDDPDMLFHDIFWAIAWMRGISAVLSLKDVKSFSIFTCDTTTGAHRRMLLDQDSEDTLHQFFVAYDSWSSWSDYLSTNWWLWRLRHRSFLRFPTSRLPWQRRLHNLFGAAGGDGDEDKNYRDGPAETEAKVLNNKWRDWIHVALNNASTKPDEGGGIVSVSPIDFEAQVRASPEGDDDHAGENIDTHDHSHQSSRRQGAYAGPRCIPPPQQHPHYSLEVVLGWSPLRIANIVFLPVLVSLVVGLILNSQGWKDPEIIEMSWVVGTYVATSGGIIAALLAIVSEIQKPAQRDV